MEALAVLQRLPAIAEAMLRTTPDAIEHPQPPAGPARWTLVARERGQPAQGEIQLRDYAQGRVLALELSEIGYVVVLRDDEGQVRLRIWPPH